MNKNIWKINLLVFGSLIVIVLAYFFWQSEQIRKSFVKRAVDRGQMLSGLVSFSLENADRSQESIEEMVRVFLKTKASFADYLDAVEPFSKEELTHFAKESNLVGIKIVHSDDEVIEGPVGWAPKVLPLSDSDFLQHFPNRQLYLLVIVRKHEPGWIMVGFDSSSTDKLMKEIGLEKTIAEIVNKPMVEYLRIEDVNNDDLNKTRLIDYKGEKLVEVRSSFANNTTMVVGIDASRYEKRILQLRKQYILFSAVLVFLAIFFSWLLHKYQTYHLQKIVLLEREIAKRNEEANLGRATAVISHEIKNPLNAIGMGLQRLLIELDLPDEYADIIKSMRQSVQRTSGIVSNLKQYSLSFTPSYDKIFPHEIIEKIIDLHRQEAEACEISISYTNQFKETIDADKNLFGQVIENIIKNAIEAQPMEENRDYTGYINIKSWTQNGKYMVSVENFNCQRGLLEADVFEPYFTNKIKGVGLGLSVSKQIVKAHGGDINVQMDDRVIKFIIEMPVNNYAV